MGAGKMEDQLKPIEDGGGSPRNTVDSRLSDIIDVRDRSGEKLDNHIGMAYYVLTVKERCILSDAINQLVIKNYGLSCLYIISIAEALATNSSCYFFHLLYLFVNQ